MLILIHLFEYVESVINISIYKKKINLKKFELSLECLSKNRPFSSEFVVELIIIISVSQLITL